MNLGHRVRGLHARFMVLVAATLLLILTGVVLILQRQGAMQREMLSHSRSSMHALVHTRLAEQGRATVERVAESLRAGLAGRGFALLAVSGGRTPQGRTANSTSHGRVARPNLSAVDLTPISASSSLSWCA